MSDKDTMFAALIVQMAGKVTTPHEMIVMNCTDGGETAIIKPGDEFTLSLEPIQENAWHDIVVVGTDETGTEMMAPIDDFAAKFFFSNL